MVVQRLAVEPKPRVVPTLSLASTPDAKGLSTILNYAARTGPLDVLIPATQVDSDLKIRNIGNKLRQILPVVDTVPSEGVFVLIESVDKDAKIVIYIRPHSRWPTAFVPVEWTSVRSGPRKEKSSYEYWKRAIGSGRPRWELAAFRDRWCGSEIDKAVTTKTSMAPFEYETLPEESVSLEYKVLNQEAPLSPKAFVEKKLNAYLTPFLRSSEPFTIHFGVNDGRAPKGVILEGPVDDFLADAREKLVRWFHDFWPPLDFEEVVLAATPAPVLPGPLQPMPGLGRKGSQSLALSDVASMVNQRGVSPFEVYTDAEKPSAASAYTVLIPAKEGQSRAAPSRRVQRYVLELSVKWRTTEANGFLIRDSAMDGVRHLTSTGTEVVKGKSNLKPLDMWLAVHQQPARESVDMLCNPMVDIVAIAGAQACNRLVPGCAPVATYDVSEASQRALLKEQLAELGSSGQPWALLVIVPQQATAMADQLNSCLDPCTLLFLQVDDGYAAQGFLCTLNPSIRVVDIFRTPLEPPSLTCALQLAGLQKYPNATASHYTPAEVPAMATQWVEGEVDLPMSVFDAGLAQPLNSQVDRLVAWISDVVMANPPQVGMLQVAKVFPCCGSTTLLRLAVAKALRQLPELEFWDGDRVIDVVTPELLASTNRPVVFVLEDASPEQLEAFKRTKVRCSVAILSSARWRVTGVKPQDTYVCNPFVDRANVQDLCQSLACIYPAREEQLELLESVVTSGDVQGLEMCHILVFVLAALRSTCLHGGVSGFVDDDLKGVTGKQKRLLFALAFVGYFVEEPRSCYVPLKAKDIQIILRFLRRGSLLRRVGDTVGFWHPWMARLVLEKLEYGDSWLLVLEKGLVTALSVLDQVSCDFGRLLLRPLLIDDRQPLTSFTKLIECYRRAVGDNGHLDDHFLDVDRLAGFLGAGASEEAVTCFKAGIYVLKSRMHRLHYCPDNACALKYARKAVDISTGFDNRHNLAIAMLKVDVYKGLKSLLTLKAETERKARKAGGKSKVVTERLRMFKKTARDHIKTLPIEKRDRHLQAWGLATERSEEEETSPEQRRPSGLVAPLLSKKERKLLREMALQIA